MKTSELTGPALDWAVAKCEGDEYAPEFAEDHDGNEYPASAYSTDWAQGGPIIEREGITLKQVADGTWRADYSKAVLKADKSAYAYLANKGQTPLVAAMRCFVASKLGEEVNIPAELKD